MSSTDDVPHKATLFCPECPHEGHLTTDWSHRVDGGRRRVVCPCCGVTATTRPAGGSAGANCAGAGDERSSGREASARDAGTVAAWRRACRSWLAVWTP